MPTNFLSLPGELRNDIFQQLLVNSKPIGTMSHVAIKRLLNPALLRANRAVQWEASSLLYGENCFDLASCNAQRLGSFLDRIGRINASRIRHVNIPFPDMPDLYKGTVALEAGCARLLARIRSDCTGLSTLKMPLYSGGNDMLFLLNSCDAPQTVDEALILVDTHLRAITSLREIIVEAYEHLPNAAIRKKMESYGWRVELKEFPGFDFERGICGTSLDD